MTPETLKNLLDASRNVVNWFFNRSDDFKKRCNQTIFMNLHGVLLDCECERGGSDLTATPLRDAHDMLYNELTEKNKIIYDYIKSRPEFQRELIEMVSRRVDLDVASKNFEADLSYAIRCCETMTGSKIVITQESGTVSAKCGEFISLAKTPNDAVLMLSKNIYSERCHLLRG